MTQEKTDDWLIKNAISCWLHHFPDHPWTERYQELVKRETYVEVRYDAPPKSTPRRKSRTTKRATDD